MEEKLLKKIKEVVFPHGNHYEGSECIIIYDDNTKEHTIADTAYQKAGERNLKQKERRLIGL